MELRNIIRGFAGHFGVRGVKADPSGAYAFEIDDLRVSFAEAGDGRSVVTRSAIAVLPSAGLERVLRMLLESSGTHAAVFSIEPGGSRLFLRRTDDLDRLDLERFEANLESFLGTAHAWRRLLAGYEAVQSAQAGKGDSNGL